MIRIRPYQPSDVHAAAELVGLLGYAASEERMRKRMEAIDSQPTAATFVAEYGGSVAGMVGLRKLYPYEQDDPVVQIAALVAGSNYRGLGIGRALVL